MPAQSLDTLSAAALEKMNKRAAWNGMQVPSVMLSILHAADKIRAEAVSPNPDDKAKFEASFDAGVQAVKKAIQTDLVLWDKGDTAEKVWGAWLQALSDLTWTDAKAIEAVLRAQYRLWIDGKKPADPSPALLSLWETKPEPGKPPSINTDDLAKREQDSAISPWKIGLAVGGVVAVGVGIWLVMRRRKAAAAGG